MARLFSLLFLFSLLNVTGCSHSVDSPSDSHGKDPRTYTWSIDTIFYESTPGGFRQTIMKDIWGLNDSLLYTVGFETNYGYGAMWKYDGRRWARIHLNSMDGGTINRAFYLQTIKGFAENDIYAFGSWYTNPKGYWERYSLGLHFDGVQWREISMPLGQGIRSLTASSPSMIYCGGWYDGQLYHFDGSQWSVDTIASRAHPELETNVNVIAVNPTQGIYLQTEQLKTTVGTFLYEQVIKQNNHISLVLDSAYNNVPWGGLAFWQSKEGNIYSCGLGGVFRLSDDKWKPFFSTDVIYSMFGTSEQHIFAVGLSNIYFYDGRKWEAIAPYVGTTFEVHVWCSETHVFISCSDGAQTYIFHGK